MSEQTTPEIRTIGVAGAGTMGRGIAQVAAQAGYRTVLQDVAAPVLEQARAAVTASLEKLAAKGTLTEAVRTAALENLTTTTDRRALGAVDVLIEAIPEVEGLKRDLFTELDDLCPATTIFASNTSSISITRLAAATGRPDRFIGMHFMNPVPLMQLVEVIRGHDTSDATTALTEALARRMGKTPVEVNDAPGFVSNRVLMPLINEAAFALHEGVGTAEAIDTVMKLGMNHPMGPLTLADFIGLDVCLHILQVLYDGFKDPKYRPCPLLVRLVDAGHLGRKTGRGFYPYE